MNTLLCIATAMVFGLALTRVAKLVKLPNVTAYLVAGLIVGPFCFNFMPKESFEGLNVITEVALGFIAFSIGGEFTISNIKRIGSRAIIITLLQACTATLLVDAVLLLCGFEPSIAITLGAIAAATAPAATLMVVRQYKAKGPVTNTLLPVVAMDDAVGLVIFSISIALAQAFASADGISLSSMLLSPLIEIGASLAVGLLIGLVLAASMRFFRSKSNRLCVTIAAVLLGVAVSQIFGLSSLLLCIMIGAMFANVSHETDSVMDTCDNWTPPLLMMFFVIAGAELDLAVLPTVGILGVLYIATRSVGKYAGTYFGARFTKASPEIRKYLGIMLLPQAGVAIGMSQLAVAALPTEMGSKIRAVVLCATLIYELVGPLLTKIALQAAGEIEHTPKKSKRLTQAK